MIGGLRESRSFDLQGPILMQNENPGLLPANLPRKDISEPSQPAREPLPLHTAPLESQVAKTVLVCPNCHEVYRLGDLLCLRCGTIFSPNSKTNRLEGYDQTQLDRIRRVGQAIVQEARPLKFEIGDQEITL